MPGRGVTDTFGVSNLPRLPPIPYLLSLLFEYRVKILVHIDLFRHDFQNLVVDEERGGEGGDEDERQCPSGDIGRLQADTDDKEQDKHENRDEDVDRRRAKHKEQRVDLFVHFFFDLHSLGFIRMDKSQSSTHTTTLESATLKVGHRSKPKIP